MVAGLNLLINVLRIDYQTDDRIGGAVISGSVQYWNVRTRFEYDKPTQLILEQGLESNRLITAVVVPGTLDIRDRDEVEVVAPRDHIDYGKRFRVMGAPEFSSHATRDPRNYMILHLTRSERAHTRQ